MHTSAPQNRTTVYSRRSIEHVRSRVREWLRRRPMCAGRWLRGPPKAPRCRLQVACARMHTPADSPGCAGPQQGRPAHRTHETQRAHARGARRTCSVRLPRLSSLERRCTENERHHTPGAGRRVVSSARERVAAQMGRGRAYSAVTRARAARSAKAPRASRRRLEQAPPRRSRGAGQQRVARPAVPPAPRGAPHPWMHRVCGALAPPSDAAHPATSSRSVALLCGEHAQRWIRPLAPRGAQMLSTSLGSSPISLSASSSKSKLSSPNSSPSSISVPALICTVSGSSP